MTSPGYVSNAEGDEWLSAHLVHRQGGVWMGLNTADPTPLADPATEVLGGGYERQPVTFTEPSAKAIMTANNQIYAGMPACIIFWVSFWAVQFGGRMICAMPLSGPQTVIAGYQFLGAAGDIVIQI